MTHASLPALLGGKTAVITGGTRGIAEVFAAAGASLMLTGQSIVVDGGQTLPEIKQ